MRLLVLTDCKNWSIQNLKKMWMTNREKDHENWYQEYFSKLWHYNFYQHDFDDIEKELSEKILPEAAIHVVLIYSTKEKAVRQLLQLFQKRGNIPCVVLLLKPCSLLELQYLEAGAEEVCQVSIPAEILFFKLERLAVRYAAQIQSRELEIPLQECREIRDYRYRGENLHLTKRQYQLLQFLLQKQGETILRKTLTLEIWGEALPEESRRLDTLVKELRQKLRNIPYEIKTIYGKGYRWEKK